MGRTDEQYPPVGGGDRDEGTDLRLEWYVRSKEDKSLPFFHKDEDIKELLLTTPHLKAEKTEIQRFFEKTEDRNRRKEYIKSIFNPEYTEIDLEDGRRVGYKTYQNVMHIWEGSYLSRTAQGYYDWGVIAEYFEGMRLMGELKDKAEPLPTVNGQLVFLDDLAEEKSSAFSIPQEMMDHTLRSGSPFSEGKFRIYSFFLQGHTVQEKAAFLKEEYGTGGHDPVLIGTGIGEDHDAKGLKLRRGFGEDAEQVLWKWEKVAKRIDELIASDRYMSQKELEYIPEYEKGVIAKGIYHFYTNQPEHVVRPYESGMYITDAIKVIRPQLNNPERIEELLSGMLEVLENTADFDRNYASMQKAYQQLRDYHNGVFSLFTPIIGEKEEVSSSVFIEPATEQVTDHVELELDDEQYEEVQDFIEQVGNLPSMNTPYDYEGDTVVYIGMDAYEIVTLSDDVVVLRNQMYPLFTEEMPRQEFERKVGENPANDHLKKKTEMPKVEELPTEQKEVTEQKEESLQELELPAEKEISPDLSPAWKKSMPKGKVQTFDLHPEIPQSQRHQFQITDDTLGQGSAKEKFRANIMAIQLLKKCEEENRYATPEEQEILSGYVGWGGLSDAFDGNKSAWETEYLELKIVLTKEEYEAARQSTLTAFYTPPVVIRSMY
ncbi:hypothetical protein N8H75_18570, partial [Extibacter muris]|nr:hypothetical protein [Extibacter muris]